MGFGVEEHGQEYTTEHTVYVTENEKIISPFHDIPAYPEKDNVYVVNVVNEIPRFTNAKREINKDLKMNPIKQDVKKGSVRFVTNIFPKKGYLWNYGAIPQTWESTEETDAYTKCKGDNDPIDAIEIGARVMHTGEVYTAKILGAIPMIDGGECDWKVVVISTQDKLYKSLNTLKDVETHMPGLLDETREWFRNYKMPGGSPSNEFGNNEAYLDAEEAAKVVMETHNYWKELVKEESHKGISLANTTQEGTPGYTAEKFVSSEGPFVPGAEPIEAHEFYFMPSKQ
ncbi:nucleosome-remodeling factor 38 kDa subunit [Nematocida sp. AWRm77]|nr:nucleosome-remodeling factor 38 kDa subunit [Nematocida sp. AWRm77]